MSEIIIYSTADHQAQVELRFDAETVWLNRHQMAYLFGRDIKTIGKHINNVFQEDELTETAVVAKFATTADDGKTYQVEHYNLYVVISVGYRVKSPRGTQFRQWARQRLREYIIKGFALDDERLKKARNYYFYELLARIRDIRSSERVFYLKVCDIFATSMDYNNQAEPA